MSLQEKTILITGGSSGIGHAVTEIASKKGAKIYSLDLHKPKTPVNGVIYIKCDIKKSSQVRRAIGKIRDEIDILINNAGTIRRGTIFQTTKREYDFIFDTNVKGSWLLLKHAEKKLSPNALVLQMSSRHGINPKAEPGIYSITKQAVISLARVLQLTKPNYKVKIACPGRVDTQLLVIGRSEKEQEEARKTAKSPDFVAEKIVELIESDYEKLLFDEKTREYRFE